MENKVTIKIPRELCQRLRQIITGTVFSSVNEFIVVVLGKMASSGEIGGEDRLTAKEVRSIRERLKRLGYFKEEE